MRSRAWDRVEQKLRCLHKIIGSELEPTERFLLANVVRTYLQLEGEEEARFAAELDREKHAEVRKMEITWEETLAAREARGEARGEAHGRIEEARSAIVRLLEFRFGPATPELRQRLRAISDLERLHQLQERALQVASIDELAL